MRRTKRLEACLLFRLLFDLGAAHPTTRDIAKTVEDRRHRRPDRGGAPRRPGALPGDHLPFGAEPRPRACRSSGPSIRYRGCTHGCHYCYARRYHAQFEMNADDEFASMILVKKNFVEVLARELDQAVVDAASYVAVGTATDCYQPIEGHYKLTRGAIAALPLRAQSDRASSRRGR